MLNENLDDILPLFRFSEYGFFFSLKKISKMNYLMS